MNNLDSAQSSSRSRLISLLPLLLLVMAGLGNAMFGAAVILPQWRAHEEAAAEVSAGKKTLQERDAPNAQQDTLKVLNGQIEGARAKLEKAASTFWSETQIDGILDRLYSYAEASAVKVSSLQSVQQAQPIKNNLYDVRVFRLQVDGPIQDLMNFVARLREASLPSVIVSNFNIVKTESQHTLTMNVLIHTSLFASGEVFSNLPNVSAPTRVPPTATATSTPTNTPTPSMTPTPSNTPTPLPATATPTITPTLSAAAAMPTSQCAGQTTQPMRRLIFSQMQDSTAACAIHAWNFTVDRTYPIVLDIQRRSGAERFRIELRDASNALLVFAPSSSDGRGILVAEVPAGNYTLNVVPLMASGNWTYTIALYSGLPSLSFSWMQSSYTSHSNAGTVPGVTRWRYTLSGAAQPYRVEANRTDGNFEFEMTVLDGAEKPIGTTKSANGKASVALNTGAGTYTVQVTARNATSGSYQIGLVR